MDKITLTFIVKEGEKILTQAENEVTKDFSLLDFVNKTIPGLEETIKAFLDKEEGQFVPRFKTEVETLKEDVVVAKAEIINAASTIIQDIHKESK